MTMRWLLLSLVASAAFQGGLDFQQQVDRPRSPITIVDPTAESYLAGAVVLKVDVSAPVKSIAFYVDGAIVCTVNRAPFECQYEAGPRIVARLVRVVATFADGSTAVETLRTKTLEIVETTSAEAVLVPTIVTDWQGRFAKGLTDKSFHVFEDGVAQTITFVKSEDVPVDVVVAVDISGSMKDSIARLQEAVKRFLARLRPIDQVTVLAFNDRTFEVIKRDTDPAARAAAINALRAFGMTSLYDAILRSMDYLGRDLNRKAVVVFTDGDDTNSLVALDAAEKKIRVSDATLYMITQGKGAGADKVRQVVNRLAEVSGGGALSIDKIDQIDEALTYVMDHLTHTYLIGYTPTNTAHDSTYRKITVTTNQKSDNVRARAGYRAPDR